MLALDVRYWPKTDTGECAAHVRCQGKSGYRTGVLQYLLVLCSATLYRRRHPMNLQRRQLLFMAATVAALPAISDSARGQTYPTHPVRVIVPFAPGGPSDVFARLITLKLSRSLGQQFYVENQPGAGVILGWVPERERRPMDIPLRLSGRATSLIRAFMRKFLTIHSRILRRSHWRRSLPMYWLFIRRSPRTMSRS
jgi:hypothetical protein